MLYVSFSLCSSFSPRSPVTNTSNPPRPSGSLLRGFLLPRYYRHPTPAFPFPVGHSFLPSPLSNCHKSPGCPPRTFNVRPPIYIELHGTTPHVPPRYTGSCAPPRSPSLWCGIPKSPYPIRNSEFGNRNSGIPLCSLIRIRFTEIFISLHFPP